MIEGSSALKINELTPDPLINATSKLDEVFQALPAIKASLETAGWVKSSMGCSYRIDYDKRFDLYIRVRNLSSLTGGKSKHSENVYGGQPQETAKIRGFSVVSKAAMGTPTRDLTPSEVEVIPVSPDLPVLSDFDSYPSLRAARTGKPAIVIAFDSEWFYETGDESGPREILSWQFAVIRDDNLHEFVFLRKTQKHLLTLEIAIGRIMDSIHSEPTDISRIRRYTSLGDIDPKTGDRLERWFPSSREALDASVVPYPDGKKVHPRRDWSLVDSVPVVLLCHTGKVDVSSLDQSGKNNRNILKCCSEVQGGLISLQPVMIFPDSLNPRYYGRSCYPHAYPVSLQVADTMCHSPAGEKALKSLGKTVGWEKIELPDGVISAMNRFLITSPERYFEYASNDSVVALLYAASLYGYNRSLPVTITSATARVMKGIMMDYLHCRNSKEFDYRYRGLKTVGHGLVPRQDRPGYVESTSKEPISDRANTIQYYSSQAYHGGYNASSDIGYFPFMTWDYDLQNAYPTAMCLVSDVDWQNPIRSEIVNRPMTLQDFTIPVIGGFNPLSMFVGYVKFRFPESVKYPCIPVNVNGVPIYPRTSEGLDGVYACGPEIFLALRLGAEVFCERGFFINSLTDPETGELSYSLRMAVRQLVTDRNRAKVEHGKKSLEELILKTMVNAGYGKNAQDVVQKYTWTALKDSMEDLGPSAITNPVSACMITSIVRAELLAAQNQCHELGYMTCSVTTDGFISDVPENVLKHLDLYGIRRYMERSRLFLTDGKDPEIWEPKHWQDDLVNFTTRGNVSLRPHGVCAHNSTKSGFPSDSYEDRLWLMKAVLSRTCTVDYTDKEWTGFKELAQGEDFRVRKVTRHIRMDFDMKRRPDRDSFEQKFVELDGEVYEIANFTTVPFESVTEFLEYRQRKETVACLRTMADWNLFWFKTDARSTKAKPRNLEWSILFSCIIGHRAGFWTIPRLNELSGEGRCEWINRHNDSGKKFKPNDWKNAGRNARQANMLPRDMLEEKLLELINATD